MYASVVTFQRAPERLEEGVRGFHEQVVPQLRQQAGFQHAYVLGDRKSGKQLGITLWDSEEHANAAMSALESTRQQSAQALGDRTPPVSEAFEVLAQA